MAERTEGIGDRGVLAKRDIRLALENSSMAELQNELAKSRILEAVNRHIRDDLGFDPGQKFSFDLVFGLSL